MPPYCLQCGCEIPDNRDDSYCTDGCAEVEQKLREWDEREARQEGR